MGAIRVGGGFARVNPTSLYIPINVGGKFVDSEFNRPSDGVLRTTFAVGSVGLNLDTTLTKYSLGDYAGIANNTLFTVNDATRGLEYKGSTIGGVHAPTAVFLPIVVNGASYTILLNAP